jgi:hypothetical protein
VNIPRQLILLPMLAIAPMVFAACGSDATKSPAPTTTEAMMAPTTTKG